MPTIGSKDKMNAKDQVDAAALKAEGKYYEAAVAYRRELETLSASPYVASSEMAEVALAMARCFESAGDQESARKARSLVASLCTESLAAEET